MKGMCLPVRLRYLNTFSSLLSYLQGYKSSLVSGNTSGAHEIVSWLQSKHVSLTFSEEQCTPLVVSS